uniref:Uncharacterized protein n=1 Tax=Heterorhabditis bacteriophora TaxID=37862 RepID=A0A1I7WW87_HETBA
MLITVEQSFKCFSVAAYEVISRINVVLNNYLIGFHIVSLMTRKTARPPGNLPSLSFVALRNFALPYPFYCLLLIMNHSSFVDEIVRD